MFARPADMHSTEADAKNSPLLRLPGELRNKIYGYALGDSFIEPLLRRRTASIHARISSGRPMSHTVSLIRTCRQTRSEAESLFFSHTTFGFNFSRYDFHRFLAHVGREKRELITSIAMTFSTLEALEQHEGRYKLPRLEYVYVRVSAEYHEYHKGNTQTLQRFAGTVGKKLGCEKAMFVLKVYVCPCDRCQVASSGSRFGMRQGDYSCLQAVSDRSGATSSSGCNLM